MGFLANGGRRVILISVVAVIALLAALLAWNSLRSGGEEDQSGQEVLITENVSIRTLTDEVTVRGELRRDELQAVTATTAGNIGVVSVADGATVDPGQVLFNLDGRNAVAVNADFPFYRSLRVGDEGPDVEQLENILDEQGYDVGVIDTVFTEATLDGLETWQRDQRYGSTTTEVAETLGVSLSPGTGYSVGARSSASVVIGGNERSIPGQLTSRIPDFSPPPLIDGGAAGGKVGTFAFQATPPEITIISGPVTVAEGGSATVQFEVDQQFANPTTVSIAALGSATPAVDYNPPGATFVFPANTTVFSLDIDTLNDAIVEGDETVEVSLVPSSAGQYVLGPINATTITIEGDQGSPAVAIASTSAVTSEGTPANFVITADQAVAAAYDISFSVVGTATAADDYTVPAGVVTMQPGQTVLNVAVQTRQDTIIEPDETLVVSLAPGPDYQVALAFEAETVIVDDDVPELTLRGRQTLSEGRTAKFFVRSDQVLQSPMTVSLQIGGTALPGTDYLQIPNTVVLPAGTDEFEITVTTVADAITEGDEEIVIVLSPSTGSYRVGSLTTARLIIRDRASLAGGGMPVVELSSDAATVFEGQPAVFTVRMHSESSEAIDVFYTTTAGSAVAGVDFSATTGRVTIPPGQLSAQIPVQTRQDDIVEGDKTVVLSLSGGADYAVGRDNSASTIIESEDLPELSITGGGTISEGDSASFTITADQAPVENTSVSYQAVGSATPGVDFSPLPGTITLPAGQRSVTVSLDSLNDDVLFLPTDMVVGDWPARIGNVSVDDGDQVQPGQPILSLTDEDFTVKLLVSATDRARLAPGQVVTANLDAGDQSSPGIITGLDDNPIVDQAGGETYEGFVTVDNEFDAVDGAVVTIDVVLEERPNAVVVPIAAVGQGGTGTDQVRVVDPESNRVIRVEVETGLIDGAFVEIVRGLEGDEIIVVRVDS